MDWILAYFLMLGVHEIGHDVQADALGYNLQWSGSIINPIGRIKTNNMQDLSMVGGAGFRHEDKINRLLGDNSLRRKTKIVASARKMVYLSSNVKHPKPIHGDLSILQRTQGTDTTNAILLAIAISDGLDLTVVGCTPYFEQSTSGTPMLALGCGF